VNPVLRLVHSCNFSPPTTAQPYHMPSPQVSKAISGTITFEAVRQRLYLTGICDFVLVSYGDLRSKWNRCRVIS